MSTPEYICHKLDINSSELSDKNHKKWRLFYEIIRLFSSPKQSDYAFYGNLGGITARKMNYDDCQIEFLDSTNGMAPAVNSTEIDSHSIKKGLYISFQLWYKKVSPTVFVMLPSRFEPTPKKFWA
jgi:hypothetical protein